MIKTNPRFLLSLTWEIPSSFSGAIFNCHRSMIENGEAENDYSNIYYFLPSITDQSEEINKY